MTTFTSNNEAKKVAEQIAKTGLENKLTKSSRGGKRINSGRKKADYETKTISFRVRLEFAEPIKKMVKDYVLERLKGDA